MPTFQFNDPQLFGSEAAELDDEALFLSYAIQRDEVQDFLRENFPVRIVSAYKGEGKSALLRLVKNRLAIRNPAPIAIHIPAPNISPEVTSEDVDHWARVWKHNLLRLVAAEVGAGIGVALSDDATALVEEAEKQSFRQRSIFSYFLDRTTNLPLGRAKNGVPNPGQVLSRWLAQKAHIWLLIDDIDHNYVDTPTYNTKVASLFTAVREVIAQIPELRFRLSIRPNIWRALRRRYEGLSHFRESIVELRWDLGQFEELLSRRVESYLRRHDQWEALAMHLPTVVRNRRLHIIGLAFESSMPWGRDTQRHPALILHSLSRHRPRWMIELAKEAAAQTHKRGGTKIGFDDIEKVLPAFSQSRLDDTIAEFGVQCRNLEELLVAFAEQPERFSTDELLKAMTNRVLQAVQPQIVGITGRPSPLEIAHFLYEIGFLSARKDHSGGRYEHLAFADNPDLLSARTNIDQGFSWEIHPVF